MASPQEHGTSRFYQSLTASGFHRIHVLEWGDPDSPDPAVICAHGLGRNAHDFDPLARALSAQGRHVLCPDIVGRGDSDWLKNPEGYHTPQYLIDITGLLSWLPIQQKIDWIGTSMGGLLGLHLAAIPGNRISKLVLNDIGAEIDPHGLVRLAQAPIAPAWFPNFQAAKNHFKESCATWGPLTDDELDQITKHSIRPDDEGYCPKMDPAIMHVFNTLMQQAQVNPLALLQYWHLWQQIRIPVLIMRGEQSDILSAKTVMAMKQRPHPTTVLEIPHTGHATPLMATDQIKAIADWLTLTP